VRELPPARFSTGSAINACARQLGAVLGISVLVALLAGGGPDVFREAWWLMGATGAAAALVAVALPSGAWTSKSAPSTTPSPTSARSAEPA
jgi:hypothetical protein